MCFFEFLCPDKSPQNARMPKRLNTLKRKKRHPMHTPHPHNENAPRSFHEYTPKFRKYHDCTLKVSHVHRCQVSTYPTKHPEVSQCAKIQGFGLPKRPSKFPPIQQSTPKFPYTHEVREFLTIHPQRPRPNTHTTPPKPFGVSDSLQNPLPFKEKFHTLGSRPTTTRATANGR